VVVCFQAGLGERILRVHDNAYFDGGAFHVGAQPLDATQNGAMPSIAVDPVGTAHVVFSWTITSNDRDLRYCVGSPAEAQQ
jgi:hypothetical protein